MRIRDDAPPGAYVCLWTNGLVVHGARVVDAEDLVPTLPFLPWAQKDSLIDVAKALWADTGKRVLCFHLPMAASDVHARQKDLHKNMGSLKNTVACQQVGLLRGGGIAHASFAASLRFKAGFKQMYEWVAGVIDERAITEDLLVAWGADVFTSEKCGFRCNPMHLDLKGGAYLQQEIVLWPPAQSSKGNTLRCGLLQSWLPDSPSSARLCLLSIAGRHTQMETGELHRCGPLARPVPPKILRGPALKKENMLKMQLQEIYKVIKGNVNDAALRQEAARAYKKKLGEESGEIFESMLTDRLEPLDEVSLRKEIRQSQTADRRALVVRALLGGLSQGVIRSYIPSCDMTSIAAKALKKSRGDGTLEPVEYFVQQGGRVGKRRKFE